MEELVNWSGLGNLTIYAVIFLGSLLYWPSTLQKKIQNSFNKTWAKTPYDSVCRDFSSLYRRLDPMREIRSKKSAADASKGDEYPKSIL